MTITIEIECDVCGRHAQTSTSIEAGVNEIEAVLDDGWEHGSAADLCPECVEAGHEV